MDIPTVVPTTDLPGHSNHHRVDLHRVVAAVLQVAAAVPVEVQVEAAPAAAVVVAVVDKSLIFTNPFLLAFVPRKFEHEMILATRSMNLSCRE